MEFDTLVTLADIAREFGVSRWAVQEWREIDGWPISKGTVMRAGRPRTGYYWGEVVEFCTAHGLPNRERQEEMRRGRQSRENDQ